MTNKYYVHCSLIILLICTVGCSSGSRPQPGEPVEGQKTVSESTPSPGERLKGELTIYAAASLSDVFTDLGKAFEMQHPGTQINFNFAGSQVLRTQLEQGAQADIYASADTTNMDILIKENLVTGDAVQVFAKNKLIVILPTNNPAKIDTLADLAKPNIKLVLADASVPAGNYARQVLENLSRKDNYGASYASQVLGNLVSNETDVRQVLTKVELGEADAGIVYLSDTVSARDLISIPIPDTVNVIAQYPIAILQASHQLTLAQQFVDYVLSAAGQATLVKWGFTVGSK